MLYILIPLDISISKDGNGISENSRTKLKTSKGKIIYFKCLLVIQLTHQNSQCLEYNHCLIQREDLVDANITAQLSI